MVQSDRVVCLSDPEMPRHEEELLQGTGGQLGTSELQAHTSHARDARCLYRAGLISNGFR